MHFPHCGHGEATADSEKPLVKSQKTALARRWSPPLPILSSAPFFQHPSLMHRLTESAKQLRHNFYRFSSYCSFAYSSLAFLRMWRAGSASFQRARKSSYAARALAVSTDIA